MSPLMVMIIVAVSVSNMFCWGDFMCDIRAGGNLLFESRKQNIHYFSKASIFLCCRDWPPVRRVGGWHMETLGEDYQKIKRSNNAIFYSGINQALEIQIFPYFPYIFIIFPACFITVGYVGWSHAPTFSTQICYACQLKIQHQFFKKFRYYANQFRYI